MADELLGLEITGDLERPELLRRERDPGRSENGECHHDGSQRAPRAAHQHGTSSARISARVISGCVRSGGHRHARRSSVCTPVCATGTRFASVRCSPLHTWAAGATRGPAVRRTRRPGLVGSQLDPVGASDLVWFATTQSRPSGVIYYCSAGGLAGVAGWRRQAERAVGGRRSARAAVGNRKVKHDPRPGWLSTVIVPPRVAVSRRTM